MASPGSGAPVGSTLSTPGKTPGGAAGHTPGSGKRRHRKKNSPKQKTDQKDQPQKENLAGQGEVSGMKDNKLLTTPKEEVRAGDKVTGPSPKKPTEKVTNVKSPNKSDWEATSVLSGSEACNEKLKNDTLTSANKTKQGEGTNAAQAKGHEEHKGQGKPQGQTKVKGQQGQMKGEGQVATGEPSGKSKAELKAERRAKQEAQRAAKEKKKAESGSAGAANTPSNKKDVPRVPDNLKADVEGTRKKIVKKFEKQQVPVRTVAQRKVRLFNHLHQYEREASLTRQLTFSSSGIHPAIVKLGLQYAEGIICGSNARCIGLLAALKKVIADYTTPPHKELSRDLEAKIKPYISFLTQCRPLSVSMGNAIKFIKWHITNIPGDMSDMRAKEIIKDHIDNYYTEKIKLAGDAISEFASSKIADDDVIVVYACSSLIRKVLCDAHSRGKKFRVIVVDGRPRLEGKEMLRRLVQEGIPSTYVLISAASYIMKEATKVLLGAHGLLANGFVMSRVGSSMIALIAKSFSVPVLVCCETYKFCKRVQTDSFVCNELGDPDDLVEIGKKEPYLMDWRDYQSLSLLNLVYDVTPPEFISVVITEIGMIPCTSVPVVLRVKNLETNEI